MLASDPQSNRISIRFAQTGYPQTYQKIYQMRMLMQAIFKDYKIQTSNQIFISKKGEILNSASTLNTQNLLRKTYVQDPSNPKSMVQAPCVYLFNHKELMKNVSNSENSQQPIIQSKAVLQKQHQTCLGLRNKMFQLKSFEQKFSQERIIKICQYNPMLPDIAKQWHKSSEGFFTIFTQYNENEYCIDEYIERWENQRKALLALVRNLQFTCSDSQKHIMNIKAALKTFSDAYSEIIGGEIQMSSLKDENLSTNVNNIVKKMNQLKIKVGGVQYKFKSAYSKIKQFKTRIAEAHKELQKKLKQIDENKHRSRKHLTQMLNEMKNNYVNLTQGLKDMIQSGDDSKVVLLQNEKKNIQAKNNQYKKIGQQYVKQSQQFFLQLYKMSKNHQLMVRSQYKIFHQISTTFKEVLGGACEQIQSQIYQMYKLVGELQCYIKQNSQKIIQSEEKEKIMKQREQKQIKRRQHFNMKLLGIQDQLKEILKQQQNKRKKFINQILSIQQSYIHPHLANTKVPCFLLNFDQTTDRQLSMEGNSSKGKLSLKNSSVLQQNINFQMNLQFYKSSSGLDRVLQQLQFIKNCQISLKKQDASSQSKIKNVQTLLQKSADIFHHIYTQKLNILSKQYQSKQNMLLNKINILNSQNSYLRQEKVKYEQNKNINSEDTKQLQSTIKKLQQKVNVLIAQKAHAENKYNQIYEQSEAKTKQYQAKMEENSKQISKLKNQKKDIQQRISKQVNSTLQTLLQQLERSAKKIKQLQDINQQYKNVMGDQQVRIVTLQSQLKKQGQNADELMSNSMRLKESFYGGHLKLAQKHRSEEEVKIIQNDAHVEGEQKLQQQLEQIELLQPRISKKQSKTITNEEIKQIQREIFKLQKQIEQLKQQNEQLKTQNMNLNEEILKIAMKDTEDQQIQTEYYEQQQGQKHITNQQNIGSHGIMTQIASNEHIKIYDSPAVGQTRLFMPFSNGVYIAVKTSRVHGEPATTQYASSTMNRNSLLQQTEIDSLHQSAWPYLIDMNCLSSKARQLLTQCTLVVALRITKILPASERFYVEGDIISALGFQDQDMLAKDYGPFLKY